MAKAKLFSFTDHSTTPSSTMYVCATSQQAAANATGRELSHIRQYLQTVTNEVTLKQFAHLQVGEFERKSNQINKRVDGGMSLRDLEKIWAIGHLNSAHITLQQSAIADPELKARLLTIITDISELRSDLRDSLEDTYTGR